jgi:hypothetical protein
MEDSTSVGFQETQQHKGSEKLRRKETIQQTCPASIFQITNSSMLHEIEHHKTNKANAISSNDKIN